MLMFNHCLTTVKKWRLLLVLQCVHLLFTKTYTFIHCFYLTLCFNRSSSKCICPIAVHRNTPFHSCFDFHSIDVHVIQNLKIWPPARGNFRPEPNHQTCKNGTGDAYVRNHKTLCSPAQNPDPQGHSRALGKHNFQTYYTSIYSCLYCDSWGKNLCKISKMIFLNFRKNLNSSPLQFEVHV